MKNKRRVRGTLVPYMKSKMKAQVFTADLIAAVLIFLLVIGFMSILWIDITSTESRNQKIESIELETFKVMESLIRTRGLPENWENLPPPEYSVDANTIGLYHMNEGSGGSTIDSSGTNPVDGDLEPGPPGGPSWITDCRINSCLEFDGLNDWVKVKHVTPTYEIKDYSL